MAEIDGTPLMFHRRGGAASEPRPESAWHSRLVSFPWRMRLQNRQISHHMAHRATLRHRSYRTHKLEAGIPEPLTFSTTLEIRYASRPWVEHKTPESNKSDPYIRLLADALERHIGSEAATGMRAPCGFGDAEALRTLLIETGFEKVCLSIVILTVRHLSLATFIPGQLAATPLAGAVAALDAAAQSALLDDIITTFQPYTDDEGLAVPLEAHVAMAWK
jgi:hypothetical protein